MAIFNPDIGRTSEEFEQWWSEHIKKLPDNITGNWDMMYTIKTIARHAYVHGAIDLLTKKKR